MLSSPGLVPAVVGFDAAATETVWSREDRETLLAWFSAAVGQLSDAEVETLRALPLFEREDGSFVPLTGLSQPRTVPEDLPGIELLSKDKDGSGSRGGNGDKELLVVFRRKTAFDAIYETLGIKPLTELELYRDHIFPRFHALSDSARLDHLRHALRYADVKLSSEDRARFRRQIEQVPCVRGTHVHDARPRACMVMCTASLAWRVRVPSAMLSSR